MTRGGWDLGVGLVVLMVVLVQLPVRRRRHLGFGSSPGQRDSRQHLWPLARIRISLDIRLMASWEGSAEELLP